MAQVSSVLARLKRDPVADLPIAACVEQLCGQCDLVWRERLLPPLGEHTGSTPDIGHSRVFCTSYALSCRMLVIPTDKRGRSLLQKGKA